MTNIKLYVNNAFLHHGRKIYGKRDANRTKVEDDFLTNLKNQLKLNDQLRIWVKDQSLQDNFNIELIVETDEDFESYEALYKEELLKDDYAKESDVSNDTGIDELDDYIHLMYGHYNTCVAPTFAVFSEEILCTDECLKVFYIYDDPSITSYFSGKDTKDIRCHGHLVFDFDSFCRDFRRMNLLNLKSLKEVENFVGNYSNNCANELVITERWTYENMMNPKKQGYSVKNMGASMSFLVKSFFKNVKRDIPIKIIFVGAQIQPFAKFQKNEKGADISRRDQSKTSSQYEQLQVIKEFLHDAVSQLNKIFVDFKFTNVDIKMYYVLHRDNFYASRFRSRGKYVYNQLHHKSIRCLRTNTCCLEFGKNPYSLSNVEEDNYDLIIDPIEIIKRKLRQSEVLSDVKLLINNIQPSLETQYKHSDIYISSTDLFRSNSPN